MTENGEKIPATVYVLGIVAGAISAYAVASLSQSPSLVAAVLGGLCGFGAVDPHESVSEVTGIGWADLAVIFASYIGIASAVHWYVVWFLGNILLAVFVGAFAGELVFKLCCGFGGSRKRKGEGMADKEDEIPQVIYFLGLVVGAIFVYAVASYSVISEWLPPFSPRGLASLGGLGGYLAVHQRVSIFQALGLALFAPVGLLLVVTLAAVLQPTGVVASEMTLALLGVPALAGAFAGGLVFNLWKALGR